MLPRHIRPNVSDLAVVLEVFVLNEYNPQWFLIDPLSIKTVVDVGAHIGSFTLWAAERWPHAVIHAYEPDPESFQILRKNMELVKNDRIIKLFDLAVWKEDTSLTFHRSRLPALSSLIYSVEEWDSPSDRLEPLCVQTRSLLNVIKEIGGCIDFLKIDCEGAEYDIIYSLSHQELRKIRFISMEYHNSDLDPSRDIHELIEYLRNAGFVTQHLPRGNTTIYADIIMNKVPKDNVTGMEEGCVHAARADFGQGLQNKVFDEQEKHLLRIADLERQMIGTCPVMIFAKHLLSYKKKLGGLF